MTERDGLTSIERLKNKSSPGNKLFATAGASELSLRRNSICQVEVLELLGL